MKSRGKLFLHHSRMFVAIFRKYLIALSQHVFIHFSLSSFYTNSSLSQWYKANHIEKYIDSTFESTFYSIFLEGARPRAVLYAEKD